MPLKSKNNRAVSVLRTIMLVLAVLTQQYLLNFLLNKDFFDLHLFISFFSCNWFPELAQNETRSKSSVKRLDCVLFSHKSTQHLCEWAHSSTVRTHENNKWQNETYHILFAKNIYNTQRVVYKMSRMRTRSPVSVFWWRLRVRVLRELFVGSDCCRVTDVQVQNFARYGWNK